MGLINSTTGHSPKQERRFANELYIAIVIIVVLAAIFFLVLGLKNGLSPLIHSSELIFDSNNNIIYRYADARSNG